MFESNKKYIFELHKKVHQIKENPTDFTTLVEIQQDIIKRILMTERRKNRYKILLNKLKSKLKKARLTKKDAALIKDKIAYLKTCDSNCQWLLYLWRCFGDAIAFSYLDKWAIKPFMFDSKTTDVKQTAGYMTEKDGFNNELTIMLELNKQGFPTLLNDITNTIRHGDLCFLGRSDPCVMEVKSSNNKNQRIERQLESIRDIHSFLENDETENLRGYGKTSRMQLSEEINYIDLINQMISDVLKTGNYSKISPELGVYYIVWNAQHDLDYSNIFNGITSQPIVCFLNQLKIDQTWTYYYPFILSIKNPELLYAFLQDNIYIIIAFDTNKLSEVAQKNGFSLTINEENWTLTEVINSPDSFSVAINNNVIGRIICEFLSWKWFITESVQQSKNHVLDKLEIKK